MSTNRAFTVLLVDDDDIDAESVIRGLKKNNVDSHVIRAHDGIEALEIMNGEHGDAPLQRPYLILLDINMPRMNGLELLSEIRKDDRLRDSIVFMLTTSDSHEDKLAAYKLNAAGYINKVNVGPNFTSAARLIDEYRMAVTLPE